MSIFDRKSDQLTRKISIIFLLLFTQNLEVNSDLMSKERSAKFLDITFPKVKKSHWLCRENLTWTQKSDFFGLFLQKSDHFWHFWPKKSDYLTLVRLIWPYYLHCICLSLISNVPRPINYQVMDWICIRCLTIISFVYIEHSNPLPKFLTGSPLGTLKYKEMKNWIFNLDW